MIDKVHQPPTNRGPGLDGSWAGGVLPEFFVHSHCRGAGARPHKTTIGIRSCSRGSPRRPALLFTVLGETPLKMLRYQQQASKFSTSRRLNTSVAVSANLAKEARPAGSPKC